MRMLRVNRITAVQNISQIESRLRDNIYKEKNFFDSERENSEKSSGFLSLLIDAMKENVDEEINLTSRDKSIRLFNEEFFYINSLNGPSDLIEVSLDLSKWYKLIIDKTPQISEREAIECASDALIDFIIRLYAAGIDIIVDIPFCLAFRLQRSKCDSYAHSTILINVSDGGNKEIAKYLYHCYIIGMKNDYPLLNSFFSTNCYFIRFPQFRKIMDESMLSSIDDLLSKCSQIDVAINPNHDIFNKLSPKYAGLTKGKIDFIKVMDDYFNASNIQVGLEVISKFDNKSYPNTTKNLNYAISQYLKN